MKKFFSFLSGFFAAVPGVSILITALGIPDPNDKLLFGAMIEVIGCTAIGILYLNRHQIARHALPAVNKRIIKGIILFIICLITYVVTFKICVVEHAGLSRVYFPLIPNKALQNAIETEGGKIPFVEKWLGDGSNKLIEKLASGRLIQTTIFLLIIYSTLFASLSYSFGIMAIREKFIT